MLGRVAKPSDQLTGISIITLDDEALPTALARAWTEQLPFVLLSADEVPLAMTHEIPVDYVNSLNQIDVRSVVGL